jgi:hypothetical protein
MARGAAAAQAKAEREAMHNRKLRCLDAFRQTEVDAWELADTVAADVVDRNEAAIEVRTSNSGPSGISVVIESIRQDLAREGIERSAGYLKQLYETSDSWPPDQRFLPEQATFTAHLTLRAVKYGNRREIMAKLIAKAGHVNQRHVKRWRAEQQPKKPVLSPDEAMEHWLERAVNRILGTNASKQRTRQLAALCRAQAGRLQSLADA